MPDNQPSRVEGNLKIEGGFFALACAASCVGAAYAKDLVLSGPMLGLAVLFACGSVVTMVKLRVVGNRTSAILSWLMVSLSIVVMISVAVMYFAFSR